MDDEAREIFRLALRGYIGEYVDPRRGRKPETILKTIMSMIARNQFTAEEIRRSFAEVQENIAGLARSNSAGNQQTAQTRRAALEDLRAKLNNMK